MGREVRKNDLAKQIKQWRNKPRNALKKRLSGQNRGETRVRIQRTSGDMHLVLHVCKRNAAAGARVAEAAAARVPE
jgi:hypothetical protein